MDIFEPRTTDLHAATWGALEQIAAVNGFSMSGLAIEIGMDPTTFNKSKRRQSDGHLRWPNAGTIARVLARTSMSFSEFGRMVDAGCRREVAA